MIDIDHKYNYQKVLSIIVTEDTGITNAGVPYLSKYREKNLLFSLLLVLFSCLSYLDMLMRLNYTKNQGGML